MTAHIQAIPDTHPCRVATFLEHLPDGDGKAIRESFLENKMIKADQVVGFRDAGLLPQSPNDPKPGDKNTPKPSPAYFHMYSKHPAPPTGVFEYKGRAGHALEPYAVNQGATVRMNKDTNPSALTPMM